jgi:aspartyl-tRNA(Asn)/glutamyl-tRNA(Gln) amidotransferase subunit B
LIEIVGEPDLRSPAEARAYLTTLKQVLVYAGVSDCSMEKGHLRVDANLSVRPAGTARFGTKTEVKNINSFANVERALEAEGRRQTAVLEAGGAIEQVTMLFSAATGAVRPMRSKEESHDYRYFPDPDLPPLVLEEGWIEEVRTGLPELPEAKRARLVAQYGLPAYDAHVVTGDPAVAAYVEAVIAAGAEPKAAANWVMTEVLGGWNETGALPVTPIDLADLIGLVKEGTLSLQSAKKVYGALSSAGGRPRAVAERLGVIQVRDVDALERWVDEVLAASPTEVARYRSGETKLLGYLVGQVMKRSQGKADPKGVQPVLLRKLTIDG